MICYKDMTFCVSPNCQCGRKLTPEIIEDAKRWWGGDGAPIATARFCDPYEAWIADNVVDPHNACREITLAMQEVFPELTRVRGHYYCPYTGERPHWWLVAPDGTIVDPTADQFPSKGSGVYVPWDESQPEPTGRCPNCGEYCYDGRELCSESCHRAYVAYCTGGF